MENFTNGKPNFVFLMEGCRNKTMLMKTLQTYDDLTNDNYAKLINHWYEMLTHSGVNSKKQVRDEMKQFLNLKGLK